MAGVGRRSDFGKPDYDTEQDVENRLDTTDPVVDDRMPFEERVRGLMDRGMSREKAVEWVNHSLQDTKNREGRKKDILLEQTRFRMALGELKNCTLVDQSCMVEDEGEASKEPGARKKAQ